LAERCAAVGDINDVDVDFAYHIILVPGTFNYDLKIQKGSRAHRESLCGFVQIQDTIWRAVHQLDELLREQAQRAVVPAARAACAPPAPAIDTRTWFAFASIFAGFPTHWPAMTLCHVNQRNGPRSNRWQSRARSERGHGKDIRAFVPLTLRGILGQDEASISGTTSKCAKRLPSSHTLSCIEFSRAARRHGQGMTSSVCSAWFSRRCRRNSSDLICLA
jgi:hypothetical protein